MPKFIKNKAHPSLSVIGRRLSKKAWKKAWSLWRSGERSLFIGSGLWAVCDFVQTDSNQANPLLVKSVTLAFSIEQSQLKAA